MYNTTRASRAFRTPAAWHPTVACENCAVRSSAPQVECALLLGVGAGVKAVSILRKDIRTVWTCYFINMVSHFQRQPAETSGYLLRRLAGSWIHLCGEDAALGVRHVPHQIVEDAPSDPGILQVACDLYEAGSAVDNLQLPGNRWVRWLTPL